MSKTKPDWNKIYLGLSPKLLGICRRYIHDIYTAEDIVQDSFILAIQKNHQLKDEKALFAWLKKIVINNALQYIRKHSKDSFVTTEPSEIPDTYSEMDHHLSEEKNIFIYDFTNEELLSSIDSLPPHHKSVFNLYFIENYSHAEISNVLGITVNTSKSHLLRAKKSVQNYLLNNIVNHNTPKKKMAHLLVIFGLGGLLWSQTFQSKFADFKISPSKKIEIPENISINNSAFLVTSNHTWRKKLIIGFTILLIMVSFVIFLNPKKSWLKNSTHPVSSNKKTGTLLKSEKSIKNIPLHLNDISDNENERTEKLKENSETEANSPHQNLEIKTNLKKAPIKDSIKEVPQKVIVVKKIIQRDTIFVEK